MSDIEFVDRHEAKVRSITMEAPEGYEFGHIVKAEVEMRVGKLEFTTDKEGNLVRTAVLVIEGAHIKEAVDPAQQFASNAPTAADDSDDSDDSDDGPDGDDDDTDASGDAAQDVERHDGSQAEVDTDTGEVREPVGAGVGNVDPDVGF